MLYGLKLQTKKKVEATDTIRKTIILFLFFYLK